MIVEYHHPTTLEEALGLISRQDPKTLPLGGGTLLNQPSAEQFAVVDLQSLGLDGIEKHGNTLSLGATLTLQSLLDSGEAFPALQRAIHHEASYNLRQVATIAGTLVAADGRSPFVTAMLALDALIELHNAAGEVGSASLGDILPLRGERLAQRLITRVEIPTNIRLAYEVVARTPADLPIVCAALARWPSGRVRLALGGFGGAPLLALDGPESGGIEQAARDAYSHAGDQWASASYRQETAAILARRCLSSVVPHRV